MDRRDMMTPCSLEATELRLGLPGTDNALQMKPAAPNKSGIKRDRSSSCTDEIKRCRELETPIAKAQVVGWPPVRSYRKNTLQAKKETLLPVLPEAAETCSSTSTTTSTTTTGLLVKVSMDGAPYLRKIDLCMYKGYKELRLALDNMFRTFSPPLTADLHLLHNMSDYSVAYQDKDGDWMLAGDVPWQMFLSSCRRLRIMKGSEAKGSGQ